MLIYFRVLKKALPTSPLLPPTLEGLARYAHRINVDFLGDLLRVLQNLLATEQLPDSGAFHCVSTAFSILQGEGSALNVDLKDFYTLLYSRLVNFAARSDPSLVPLALHALQRILLDRKQLSSARVAAYAMRLAEVALHCAAPISAAFLQLLGSLVAVRPRLRSYPLARMTSAAARTIRRFASFSKPTTRRRACTRPRSKTRSTATLSPARSGRSHC